MLNKSTAIAVVRARGGQAEFFTDSPQKLDACAQTVEWATASTTIIYTSIASDTRAEATGTAPHPPNTGLHITERRSDLIFSP